MTKEKIIADLSRFSDKEMFAKWLWTELCSFHRGEGGDLYLLTSGREYPIDSLDYVYRECIPAEKQIMFRQAIGDVLLERGNNEDSPIEALEDLVYLIVATEATEALPALLSTVGNGLLGKRYPEILFPTMAGLKTLSVSPAVCETTLGLINSENFDDGYLLEAIKILNECEPSQARLITEELKPRLIKIREEVQIASKDEQDEFRRVVEESGLDFLSFLLE